MQRKLKLSNGDTCSFSCLPLWALETCLPGSWPSRLVLPPACSHAVWSHSNLNVQNVFCIYVALTGNLVYMKSAWKIFFFAVNSKTWIGLFFCIGRHHSSFNQAQKNSLFFPRFVVIWYLHTFLQFTKTGKIVGWVWLPHSFWKDENEWILVRYVSQWTLWAHMHLFKHHHHHHLLTNTCVQDAKETCQTDHWY